MKEQDIDAVAYVSQTDVADIETNSNNKNNAASYINYFGPVAGLPDMMIPMGFAKADPDNGYETEMPLGMSLFTSYGNEEKLIEMIDEERLQYMGSVVLGLNDALVEFTGALAGFTLALNDTKLIALTGSITGIAAALSMASSEYLSTKSEKTYNKRPVKAAIYTGIAYIITVVALVGPFILLSSPVLALCIMLVMALLIIAFFNYYYAIARNESFKRRFTEMAVLSFSVAGISFLIGYLLKAVTGVGG